MALPTGAAFYFLLGYTASTIVAGGLAIIAFHHRTDRTIVWRVLFLSLAAAVWSAGGAFKLVAATAEGTLLWHRVGYVGLLTLPVLMVLFAISFGGHERLLSRRFVAGLFLLPALAFVALLTDPLHHRYYADTQFVSRDGATILVTDVGPLFWAFATYSWGLLFVAIGLLGWFATRAREPYASQSLLAMVGMAIPWPVNLLYNTGTWPYPGLDPTPIAVGIGLTAVGVATIRGQFLDLLPVAREEVLQSIDDPIVIIDERQRIADFNRSAGSVLGIDETAVGKTIEMGLPSDLRREHEAPFTWKTAVDGTDCYYSVHFQPIQTRSGNGQIGTSLVMRDVTPLIVQQLTTQRESDIKESVREAIFESKSRDEVESILCEKLVSNEYIAAWTGGWDAERISLRAVAGFEGTELPVDGDATDRPWHRAIETKDIVVGKADGEWPLDGDKQVCAVAAVPLSLQGVTYGVLVVYSTADGFDRHERQLLRDLADTLAFAFAAIERREALFGDQIREAKLRLTDPDHYLVRLAGDERFEGSRITVYDILIDDGTLVHFLDADGGELTHVTDALAGHPAVLKIEPITESDNSVQLKVRVRPPTVATTLAEMGGIVRSKYVENGTIDVVVNFSRHTDIQQVLGRLEETFHNTKLISLRNRERTAFPPTDGVSALLSPKQYRALEAAFRNGFFERPQRRTAEEIAVELGIARTTFLQHVREAEHQLMDRVFE